MPFSPVHNARKFSVVFGTTSSKSSNSIRPFSPMQSTSKNTLGNGGFEGHSKESWT